MKLRERLRQRLLAPDRDKAVSDEDIYFAGFNALSTPHQRKLEWAGRMTEAMSFARAWRVDPRLEARGAPTVLDALLELRRKAGAAASPSPADSAG